ncbi:hypothetical protein [Geotalea toluenoxydans]|uniref:hypothetical protein n=1 Tax=Geotalea toluenoxydans TaxID=421624 RepID=UPI0006D24D3F|nr:hypothetical protein [Geotalea toluenoxydans]
MTLNECIIECVKHRWDNSYFEKFMETEVFFSIVQPNQPLQAGPLITTNLKIRLSTAKLDVGCMALFYTSKLDTRLSQHYGGMPLLRAIEMVCNMDGVDGMLIQSDGEAWVVANKDALRKLLSTLPSQRD